MKRFVEFALEPSNRTAADVPFDSNGLWLGLSSEPIARVAVEDIADRETWSLQRHYFRAYVGPFSALRLIDEHVTGEGKDAALRMSGDLALSVGEHPHCVSPPISAPEQVASLRRVSLQPSDALTITSCIGWFTVDLFVDGDGTIEAVTLDLWEP